MLSLNHFRNNIFKHKFSIGIFCLFFLATALFAGFAHNHSDDPFHAQEHTSCPVSIWVHTPFANISIFTFGLFALLFIGMIYSVLSDPFLSIHFFTRFSRGPPNYFL